MTERPPWQTHFGFTRSPYKEIVDDVCAKKAVAELTRD